jgi:hypothetical protein
VAWAPLGGSDFRLSRNLFGTATLIKQKTAHVTASPVDANGKQETLPTQAVFLPHKANAPNPVR